MRKKLDKKNDYMSMLSIKNVLGSLQKLCLCLQNSCTVSLENAFACELFLCEWMQKEYRPSNSFCTICVSSYIFSITMSWGLGWYFVYQCLYDDKDAMKSKLEFCSF